MITLQEAIDFYGSQAALARALEITPGAVHIWKLAGRLPRLRQFQLEVVTKGKLKAGAEQVPEVDIPPEQCHGP